MYQTKRGFLKNRILFVYPFQSSIDTYSIKINIPIY